MKTQNLLWTVTVVVISTFVVGILATPAQAVSITDINSIRITNEGPDWYYVEEYTIPNAGGTDVASLSFGTSASSDNFNPAFGSTDNGGVSPVVDGRPLFTCYSRLPYTSDAPSPLSSIC